MKKSESAALGWLIAIGLPIYGISKVGEMVGWIQIVIALAVIVGLVFWYKENEKKKRRAALMKKYQDRELVDSLMSRKFWQGQSSEQLLDSLGQPADIDQKIMKTRKREIWKYHHQGANRYGLRITLDNDEVAGWDQKA